MTVPFLVGAGVHCVSLALYTVVYQYFFKLFHAHSVSVLEEMLAGTDVNLACVCYI